MAWTPGGYPLPPTNPAVVSPFIPGALDLRWDDPSPLEGNEGWDILGVNVYRSDASDRGPFVRVNTFPVGGGFYRDATSTVRVGPEPVSWETGWANRGGIGHQIQWTIRTEAPIYQRDAGVFATTPADVSVEVDGVRAWVVSVFGQGHEVTINPALSYNPATERWVEAPLPLGPASVVTVTYYTKVNTVRMGGEVKPWYRLTTVARDPEAPEVLHETPLSYSVPVSPIQVERLDYIWREAVRRNRWILEQGGERVKLFVQRIAGTPCFCRGQFDIKVRVYADQPSSRCLECYGTGWVGGYEGPYDVIMAPDDGEKRLAQTEYGRRLDHSYAAWMSLSPVVSQRDFFIKQDGDRYSIGAVTRPTNRGNLLQQHFEVRYIPPTDIRYRVPIIGSKTSPNLPWPQTRYTYSPLRETYDARTDPAWSVETDAALPLQTEKDGVASEVELRFRTGTGENQNY